MMPAPVPALYARWLQLDARLLWCNDVARDVTPEIRKRGREIVSGHTHSHIFYVKRGTAEAEMDGQIYRAGKGEWLVVEPRPRVLYFSPRCRVISIAFDAKWPDGSPWLLASTTLRGSRYREMLSLAHALVRSKLRISRKHWDVRGEFVTARQYFSLQGRFQAFLGVLGEALEKEGAYLSRQDDADVRVSLVKRAVERLLPGGRLNRPALAAEAGLSVAQLDRLFIRQIGVSLARYYQGLRCEQAKARLQLFTTRIKEVAYEMGFSSLPHFSAWFTKHAGTPPRRWRSEALARLNRKTKRPD